MAQLQCRAPEFWPQAILEVERILLITEFYRIGVNTLLITVVKQYSLCFERYRPVHLHYSKSYIQIFEKKIGNVLKQIQYKKLFCKLRQFFGKSTQKILWSLILCYSRKMETKKFFVDTNLRKTKIHMFIPPSYEISQNLNYRTIISYFCCYTTQIQAW